MHFTKISDSIFTVSDFLSPEECDEYIQLTEQEGYDAAPITTAAGPVHCPHIRNNTRVMIDDVDRAEAIWRRAAGFVDEREESWKPIGLNERFRFYRYDVGQQFDWHLDGWYERPNGERSWLTFMIYLNADFGGGETAFDDAMVAPQTGMALFFVHDLMHRGCPVTEGRKYVMRSDVMFRRSS